ncbi:MAG: NUDIX domain-containing protein [Clostridiaceae bacterium]|jgi:8-oxo-dGTP pyrophosphatase MutT (NUDIX family)|nr:NUDIX domain-containing protein [Clostridiaceae bacterium]
MNLVLDLKNYDRTETVFQRRAARAIVWKGERILLISGRYGDCKFPGGGIEPGERLEDTLAREVAEETGYRVDLPTVCRYGQVLERRKGLYEDVMEMVSYYFTCTVLADIGRQRLDAYEQDHQYQAIWIPPGEAIARNKQVTDLAHCPWVTRETLVLEHLLGQKEEETT